MFHLMFVHYTFSSVLVAEWQPSGKLLCTRLATYCILSICILFISHFGFKSECHHNARARRDQLVSDDENSLTDKK